MSLMKKALKLLEIKSERAIKKTKTEMLSIDVEDKRLREAIRYYAHNLDDSLHPGILAIAYESIGKHVNEPVEIQVAMLFLTSAVDIHDDVIDESYTKNGRPTIFGKFGRNIALLVGDGMLLKGMSLLYNCKKMLQSNKMKAIISTIQNTFFEAGDAHSMETFFKIRGNSSIWRYYRILNKKAAILECHTRIGAIVGDASRSQIKVLGKYGRLIGLLLTLRDEFIDVFEPEEVMSRIKKGYPPLPLLFSLENPKTRRFMRNIMSQKEFTIEKVNTLISLILEDNMVMTFRRKMEDLVVKALKHIEEIPINENLKILALSTIEGIK